MLDPRTILQAACQQHEGISWGYSTRVRVCSCTPSESSCFAGGGEHRGLGQGVCCQVSGLCIKGKRQSCTDIIESVINFFSTVGSQADTSLWCKLWQCPNSHHGPPWPSHSM